MATRNIYIYNIVVPPDLPIGLNVNFYYRLKYSDTFHLAASGIPVDVNGNFSPGVPLTLTVGVPYVLRAENDLCGFFYDQEMIIPDEGCICPPGYTLSPDSTYCFKLDIQPATYTGGTNPITLCHYQNLTQYGVFGSVFYKLGKYNVDGTWNISDPTALPTIKTTSIGMGGYNSANFVNSIIANPNVWIDLNTSPQQYGRLNLGGLWVCGSPNLGGTFGFSRQITLPSSQVYYIGVGSDNFPTVTINGTIVIQQDATAAGGSNYFNNTGGNFLFRYWHVFPVQLNAGPNIIELDVDNAPGTQGILGYEIYEATESQLLSCVTMGDLEPYIIFTTRDIPNGSLSDIGNYSCSAFPGYTLVNDNGNYTCQRLFQEAPTGC